MDELTLERIAKIRADITENASDESYWDARAELLDAAERGLLADRKAAAFDRLSAIMARGRSACLYPPGTASQRREVRSTYLIVSAGPFSVTPNPSAVYTSDSVEAPTLLEAIEQLPTNGEPK